MTIFKVCFAGRSLYYRVNKQCLKGAIRELWNVFGDSIRYDIVMNFKK